MKSLSILLQRKVAAIILPKKFILLVCAIQFCLCSSLFAGSRFLYKDGHRNHPVKRTNNVYTGAITKTKNPATIKKPVIISPPTLSYSSPQSYVINTAITPLSPTSSGVAAAGYSGLAAAFKSGFTHPRGISTDGASNVFVSDFGSSLITEYPSGGGASITIGSGFQNPDGVAVDGQENIYVSDYGSGKIKKVLAGGGTITTIGTGYNAPYGVAADAAGNAYVADYLNGVVRKIPANGGATVIIGAGFTSPAGVVVDAAGNVYVADFGASLIKKILASDGSTVTLGSGFANPYGVTVDHLGNVFVADFGNHALKEIPVGGGATITIASGFTTLTGVTLDNTGMIYTADYDDNSVESFKPTGGYYISPALPAGLKIDNSTGIISGTPTQQSVSTRYTITAYNSSGSTSFQLDLSVVVLSVSYASPQSYSKGAAISPLTPTSSSVGTIGYSTSPITNNAIASSPYSVKVDALNNVYTIQANVFTVTKYPAGGGATSTFGSGFINPVDLDIDASGNIYVADFGNNAIKKIPAGNGTPVVIGSGFSGPNGVAVDAAGNVYVADTGNNLVKEVPAGGGAIITLGSGFNLPSAVAVDAAGNVYVADRLNGAIKKIPAGNGTPVTLVSGLNDTYGVAVDPSGNVFYSDRNNNVVQELIGGTGSPVNIGSGFNLPYKLGLDAANNVYVADFSNKAIKKITPVGGFYLNSSLPAGLSFSSATGTISGTPTAISPATNYTVTAYNSLGSGSAVVNIKVSVSANANLSGLTLSAGTLSPVFSAATTNYTASVSNGLAAMTITPTAADPSATITVNGVAVISGSVSQSLPLVVGPNTITTVVTAGDGTTQYTYTLVVTEAKSGNDNLSSFKPGSGSLSPVFSPAVTSYTESVANSVQSITFTPTTTVNTATVKVNGITVASGTASSPISLAVGPNTITGVVTAQNGTSIKTYTVTVTRAASINANLASMGSSVTPLSPSFTPGTTSYNLNVSNAVASMTVKPVTGDPNATIKVNGTLLASGTVSAPIALAEGTTTAVNVVVTAQDGITTKTYTITVTRAPSANAGLANIALSSGTLSPVFATATLAYTASVSNATASITVTPTSADANATIKVNGTAVTSGTASGAIALNVGANIITTMVTAQDGSTTKTYTATVTRVGSANASLASMSPSITPLSPIFAPATTSYTLSVVNSKTSMTVKPVTSDANATLKVNGTTLVSGTVSPPIALAVGPNTITVVVTAQDGTTTKTYTITATRAAPGANSFDPGISVTRPTETPVLAEDGIVVHPGVSPNGDGINDFLQIDNINQYPDNKLSIMNRNGLLIFETKGYDNSSKVFNGRSKSGQVQLPGTYFYQLDYTVNGITKHKTGFIVLKY